MNDKNALDSLSEFQIYLRLFLTMFVISASTFGGGFVIISMIKEKMVSHLHWFTEEEMLDMAAIAQSAPGPLGVNMSVMVGYRIRKVPGAMVCAIGTALPPLIIISVICMFYRSFRENPYIGILLRVMRAGVAAVIVSVVIDLGRKLLKTRSPLWISVMIGAFVSVCFLKIKVPWIILTGGVIGLVWKMAGEGGDRG